MQRPESIADGVLFSIWAVFSIISAVFCIWALFHLYRGKAQLRHRLFFFQLVCLESTDLLWAILSLFNPLTDFGLIQGSFKTCDIVGLGLIFLEFCSIGVEVHIAASYFVACWGVVRATRCLLRLLPSIYLLSLVVCAALLFIPESSEGRMANPDQEECGEIWRHMCTSRYNRYWAIVTVSGCLCALLLYGAGAAKLAGTPFPIRRQVLIRGGTYIASFLLSYGPFAMYLVITPTGSHCNHILCLSLMNFICLNGAMNAGAYMVGMWTSKPPASLIDCQRAETVGQSRDDMETVSVIEEAMFSKFFDLYLDEDELTYNARRRGQSQ